MTYLPKTLPDQLRKAGLTVVTIDGWETRGRPASTGGFTPVGVLNHHTGAHDGLGDPQQDLEYARWMFLTGRSDLPAPLCQLALSAEGVVYLGAAGRANHAGEAKPSGSVAGGDGNRLYVGIEWMLSGKQAIPDKMYKAGAILNAVLLKVLGSSVQALSCHYQTSVTGKWDIGDPNGIPFRGTRVLDVTKFRKAVAFERDRLDPPKVKEHTDVKIGVGAMQYSDNATQQEHDLHTLFARKWDMGVITEAGPNPANALRELLKSMCKEYGYKLHLPSSTSTAVIVKKKFITDSWGVEWYPVIPGVKGKYADRGPVVASFRNEKIGYTTMIGNHLLTKGRPNAKDPDYAVNLSKNRRIASVTGEIARKAGRGPGIVFEGGDKNIPDRFEDTYFGHPMTSCWDELEKWPKDGAGTIINVGSYDKDGRVVCLSARSLGDHKLPLFTDHPLVESVYRVRHLKES